jgi:hypothetical protein
MNHFLAECVFISTLSIQFLLKLSFSPTGVTLTIPLPAAAETEAPADDAGKSSTTEIGDDIVKKYGSISYYYYVKIVQSGISSR